MTARVIQGFFAGGGPRPLGSVAQPKTQHHAPSGPPVPAFAGRALVMQPRQPGPPAPAFAGRSPVVQPHGAGDAFPVDPARLGLANGGGRPLPDALRGRMEAALGADFSAVRVHVGPQAERIGAIAFTLGSDIYFAPGRFQPDTAPGQQLLGHELAHVVQQRQGRVRNPMGTGIAVVQDRALEAEADRLGQRAATSPPIQAKLAAAPPMSPARPASPVRISAPIKAGPASYRLTAGTEGRQIGSVMVHARDKASVEVTDLGVDPAHREHGIGKLLLASAARTGLQSGKSKVTLAAQDNGSGHLTQWYKGMGFAQTGVNQRGYPRLEAPIGRVLTGTAQRSGTPEASPPSLSVAGSRHRDLPPPALPKDRHKLPTYSRKGRAQFAVTPPRRPADLNSSKASARAVQRMYSNPFQMPDLFGQWRANLAAPMPQQAVLGPAPMPQQAVFVPAPMPQQAVLVPAPVPQPDLSDADLREYFGTPIHELNIMFNAAELKRYKELYAESMRNSAREEKWEAAQATLTRQNGLLTRWEYDGDTWHLNIEHVSKEGSPMHHYYFTGIGMDVKSRRPTKQEVGRQHPECKHAFSELPQDHQEFIKRYVF